MKLERKRLVVPAHGIHKEYRQVDNFLATVPELRNIRRYDSTSSERFGYQDVKQQLPLIKLEGG